MPCPSGDILPFAMLSVVVDTATGTRKSVGGGAEESAMRGRRWIELLLVIIAVSVAGKLVSESSQPAALPTPTPLSTVANTSPETPAPASATPSASGTPWEPFTTAARKSIVAAQEAASKEKASKIDCRHFVIGLREVDPKIDEYLIVHKVDLSATRSSASSSGELVFTADAKQAIEFAFEECRSDEGSSAIETGHLFRGVLRTDSQARKLLNKAGANSDDFKEWLKRPVENQK